MSQGGDTVTLDFVRMTSSIGPVERLSTPSYVVCRDKIDATRWLWYWNAATEVHADWRAYEVSFILSLSSPLS